jgi:glycine/D-amino acid oxidase-like deaminating enzyme
MSGANQFDVAVIGGWLVGTAIAWGLRALGSRLVVLDEGDVAHRASRGNFGLVWVQGKGAGLPQYGSWTQLSARRWPELAARLAEESGIDVALLQPGGIHPCLTRRELDVRISAIERLLAQPGFERYEVQVLDRAALAQLLPGVGPDVAGGTYCTLDGHCNPLRLLRALHAALQRAGGAYRPNHGVKRIVPRGDGFDIAVPGARSPPEGRPRRRAGQRRARADGRARGAGAAAEGAGDRARARQPFLDRPLATIRQTDEGTVLIGDSQEEKGFDDSLGVPVLAVEARRALAVFPFLREVRVNRTWAALRVMTPDSYPIYEQSPAHPGAFLATCHSGVTLAAAHAFVFAPAVASGALPETFRPYRAGRFDVQKVA